MEEEVSMLEVGLGVGEKEGSMHESYGAGSDQSSDREVRCWRWVSSLLALSRLCRQLLGGSLQLLLLSNTSRMAQEVEGKTFA